MTPNERSTAPLGRKGAREVVFVGIEESAQAWLTPLRRSARFRIVATVAPAAVDASCHRSIEEALRLHPAAVFALALPPRTALEGALQLATANRPGLVQAPLHDALCEAELEGGAAEVRVSDGWVTLPGLRAVKAVLRRVGSGRLEVEIAGTPDEDHCDLDEGLAHAAALVRTLLPRARPRATRHLDGAALEVELEAGEKQTRWTIHLRLLAHGQRLAVQLDTAFGRLRWTWDGTCESVVLGETVLAAPRVPPPAPVRALAQLLPGAVRGDNLIDAASAIRLKRACLSLLPTRLPLGAKALQLSAAIARRRPTDLLGRLGLRGKLPEGGPPPNILRLEAPPEPFELWAFRAGIKPVAFLTVPLDDVERTLAFFGDAHHERRERRVRVGAQDRWTDRRDEGEPRVELYVSHDAALARRAAHLQAEVDPSAAIREIGALVGYPPCCVEAFAHQDDRSNNTANRYESHARTVAPDGSSPTPWPWELNNLHTVIIPFYPCSYRCERALAWARAALAEMSRAHPGFIEDLRTALARPVLYFDHDHQLVFDGECDGPSVRYSEVALPPSAPPELAELGAACGMGNHLRFDDRQLAVDRDGAVVLDLLRTDPALGFVAPFGVLGGAER